MDEKLVTLKIFWYGRDWFCMAPDSRRLFSWGLNAETTENALAEIARQLNGAAPQCEVSEIPLEKPCDAITYVLLDQTTGLSLQTTEAVQELALPPKNGKPERKEG